MPEKDPKDSLKNSMFFGRAAAMFVFWRGYRTCETRRLTLLARVLVVNVM